MRRKGGCVAIAKPSCVCFKSLGSAKLGTDVRLRRERGRLAKRDDGEQAISERQSVNAIDR